MGKFLSKYVFAVAAVGVVVALGSCGNESSRDRNALVAVGTSCTKAGQVSKTAGIQVVCASTSTGKIWYQTKTAKGKAVSCATLGKVRKKANIVWVCGLSGGKKTWRATAPLPAAVFASSPVIESTKQDTSAAPVIPDNNVLSDPKIPDDTTRTLPTTTEPTSAPEPTTKKPATTVPKKVIASAIKQFGTEFADGIGAVTTDAQGNVFVAGFTNGSLVNNQTNYGASDVFVAKFDDEGTKIWIKQFGSNRSESLSGIVVDASGNIFVTGMTTGLLAPEGRGSNYDIFLVRLDADGKQIWLRQLGASKHDIATSVAVDSQKNIYVVGETYNALEEGVALGGISDVVFAKLDFEGKQLWIKQFGSSKNDSAKSVVVDSRDNVYIAGETSGELVENQLNSGLTDSFLAKFNSNGNRIWLKQFGGIARDTAWAMAIDQTDNLYVAGFTNGALAGNLHIGSEDVFGAKFDSSGNQLWIKQLGTREQELVRSVAVSSDGNVYIVGATRGIFAGDSPNAGGSDIFIVTLNTDGEQQPTRQIGTSSDDQAWAVDVSDGGNVYVAGVVGGEFPGQFSAGLTDAVLLINP
jgi:hypothetical protein